MAEPRAVADPTARPDTSPSPEPPPPTGQPRSNLATIGPLQAPDANGIRLPGGFTSRIVATSGDVALAGSGYAWHRAPDGGAVFDVDGGWIYVSNSEADAGGGGVGALQFDTNANLVGTYPILSGTSRNCSGGKTPWGTWLSCEEFDGGAVWECDPTGRDTAVALPALGIFSHEAVAADPATGRLYLTEDKSDGRWYRFTPDSVDASGRADLSAGILEAARNDQGSIEWLPVPDPSGTMAATRLQVPESTAFDGGEGTCWANGVVYFTTKGDNRVWAYEIATHELTVIYDVATAANPILSGVDNLEATVYDDLLVAEDGGDMQIVVITAAGETLPLLQVTGHDNSEITGPAFTSDFGRLYFSSQRGASGDSDDGVTYEIVGPFTVVD